MPMSHNSYMSGLFKEGRRGTLLKGHGGRTWIINFNNIQSYPIMNLLILIDLGSDNCIRFALM